MAFPIILGVNDPQYTPEELEKFRADNEKGVTIDGKHYTGYEATQMQRKLERAIRKQKTRILIDETAGDKEKLLTDQIKLQRYRQEYSRFSKAAGLRTENERTQVAGFGRKKGTLTLVGEQSPRPVKKTSYAVDWSAVQSEEYSRKFDKLSVSDTANAAVRTRANWALNNRDGTDTEELYVVNMCTGREVARITDQHHSRGVVRTEQFDKAIKLAGGSGEDLMLIHNHPGGSPPSIGDLNALLSTPKAKGITVGHDGSLYLYTAPKKKIPQSDFDIAFSKKSRYTILTAYEKALEELSEIYGFTFERL